MNENKDLISGTKLRDNLSILSNELSVKKWDFGASISNDISVQIDKGNPKQLKASQKSSLTIRVWNDNKIGITSTSDLSKIGLKKALNSALEASNFGNINETPDFSIAAKDELPKLERPLRKSYGIKKLMSDLIHAEEALLNKDRSIKSVPYNGFAESISERVYINSDGALRHIKSTQASLYLYARAEEPGRKPRSSGSIKVGYGAEDININECINEAASRTISHLNYKPIKTGKYLVCFKPEAFLDLITAFSNIYNARAIIDGISLSTKDSIGRKISNEILSMNDDGLHQSNFGACTFDGEGTPTQNIPIIEAGILRNFIHSEATARYFDTRPTGHGGIGSKASVSPDWPVVFKANGKTAKYPELNFKESNEEFVLVENLHALHAGIKASQGSFSLPFDGWLVKNKDKISIESATIAGDFINLLNNIIQVETNQQFTHQGVSPHIWVNELAITGDK